MLTMIRSSWHQTLRSGLEGVSDFVAHGVLQLPRHGLLQRYTKIICSFGISGVMHIFADMGGGLSIHETGALQFFLMQALGIMIEDGVQAIYRQTFKSVRESKANVIGKAVGFAWVLFFFVWTSPVWVFPATRKMQKEDAYLSIGAMKPLFGKTNQ